MLWVSLLLVTLVSTLNNRLISMFLRFFLFLSQSLSVTCSLNILICHCSVFTCLVAFDTLWALSWYCCIILLVWQFTTSTVRPSLQGTCIVVCPYCVCLVAHLGILSALLSSLTLTAHHGFLSFLCLSLSLVLIFSCRLWKVRDLIWSGFWVFFICFSYGSLLCSWSGCKWTRNVLGRQGKHLLSKIFALKSVLWLHLFHKIIWFPSSVHLSSNVKI